MTQAYTLQQHKETRNIKKKTYRRAINQLKRNTCKQKLLTKRITKKEYDKYIKRKTFIKSHIPYSINPHNPTRITHDKPDASKDDTSARKHQTKNPSVL